MAIKKMKPARSAAPGKAAENAASNNDRLKAMAEVVKGITSVVPASEVIRDVNVVPTIFPLFDDCHVGGLPLGRLILVQGPSNEGKSVFTTGLGRSFLERDHFFHLIDAERTMTKKWTQTLMGNVYDHPGFTCPDKIGSYEDVRKNVRQWCDSIGNAREKGLIDKETSGLIVLDSLKKLAPKNLLEELVKSAASEKKRYNEKGHVDGFGGRAGQLKAAFNAAWVDELTAILADTNTTMVIIVREHKEPGEGWLAKEIIKSGGGTHVKYDSSLWLRVVDSPVYQKIGEEDKCLVGHRHTVEIHRSKVRALHNKVVEGAYHTSNGKVCPEGFDRARDVFELGVTREVIEQKASYYSFEGEVLGQGEPKAIDKLREDTTLMMNIETECRKKFLC